MINPYKNINIYDRDKTMRHIRRKYDPEQMDMNRFNIWLNEKYGPTDTVSLDFEKLFSGGNLNKSVMTILALFEKEFKTLCDDEGIFHME